MIEDRPATLALADDPSPLRIDEDGVVRVGPTRVTLETVVGSYKDGASPGGILERYPVLSLPDIYGTIAYYLRHRIEVDAYLDACQVEAERVRQTIQAVQPRDGLKERLLARRDAARG
jgi:uncharacterized protein (DUF433 family)